MYLNVCKKAASVCDIHKTSVDFRCWWQNGIELDFGCGCLLSNLERFYDKILIMNLFSVILPKRELLPLSLIVITDSLQPLKSFSSFISVLFVKFP